MLFPETLKKEANNKEEKMNMRHGRGYDAGGREK
jgi:hypothetical protein